MISHAGSNEVFVFFVIFKIKQTAQVIGKNTLQKDVITKDTPELTVNFFLFKIEIKIVGANYQN